MEDKEQKRRTLPAAVAVKYDAQHDSAPRVVAAGRGQVAEAIKRLADEHAIPIWQDEKLAHSLARVELGSTIPPELYTAVAEVLAFLWRLEARSRR